MTCNWLVCIRTARQVQCHKGERREDPLLRTKLQPLIASGPSLEPPRPVDQDKCEIGRISDRAETAHGEGYSPQDELHGSDPRASVCVKLRLGQACEVALQFLGRDQCSCAKLGCGYFTPSEQVEDGGATNAENLGGFNG